MRKRLLPVLAVLLAAVPLAARNDPAQEPPTGAEHPGVLNGLVFVEGGTFRMGSIHGAADETPIRDVTLDDFWMSPFEVTQDEYKAVMGRKPSEFKGGNRPVERVTWYEAAEYCNALSRLEGLEPVYSGSGDGLRADFSRNGYRLPTEAEWEYAANGGQSAKGDMYSGSSHADRVAWYDDNSGDETHPVGGKAPNELGLYDMSGNVFEWCWDWYDGDYYKSGPQRNPRGPQSGTHRGCRGGSWFFPAFDVRPSYRFGYFPNYPVNDVGFRICRNAE